MANAVDGAGSANNCQHRRKSSVEDDLYPVHSTFYRRLRPRHVARLFTRDGSCSSADQTHDAVLGLYARRFNLQVELTQAIHFPESARIVNLGSDHSPVALGR
jgi:hypothetical protein